MQAEGDIDSCPDGKEGREDEREGSTDDEYGESRSDAGSGDSTFEDSGMEEDEDSPEARERAYEEARAMLRDQGGRRRDQFLEEEVLLVCLGLLTRNTQSVMAIASL